MNAIVNTKLIMEDGIIWDGVLLFEDGIIVAADWADKVEIPEGANIIDAGGKYTAPGLIDIHVHGANRLNFHQDPMYCCEFFIKHGHTTVLPTFYCSLSLEEMLEGAEKVRKASKVGAGRIMDGLYMEGPYMNGTGSNQKYIKWGGDLPVEEYAPLVAGLGDMARIWAICPTRKNIDRFMKYVKDHNPNAIFALGHTFATSEECKKVYRLGVKVQTHTTDSGKAKGRAHCTSGAGADEFTLYNPDMYAELICDQSGVHVVPDLIKMIIRTKGVEKICLITDHMGCETDYPNSEARGVWYGPDLNYDEEGLLAGSRLTLDGACRNIMKHTGYGLCHAIRMATLNPAMLLGIDDKVGSIEVGKKANLIIIDDMVNVEKVFLEGDLMVDNK